MKTIIPNRILLSTLMVAFLSCKNAEAEKETAPTPSVESSYLNKEKKESKDVAYNPAHGQPNHRCDLPVGAPLNKAATRSNPTSNSGESPVRLKSAAPKTNPPHGEPGHDCSIPVGAALN